MVEGKAQLIDVREPHEYATKRLSGATLIPSTAFHAERLPDQDDRIYVFYCRAGVRSAKCAKIYMDQTGAREAYHLGPGIDGWVAEDCPIELSMMQEHRQERFFNLFLGLTLLISVALTWFLHPFALVILVVLGLFMLHAAWSGTSLVAWFLSRFIPTGKPRMR